MIEAPFALFQEEVKEGFWDAVVSSQMAFHLVPKILDPIDVVSVDRKNLRMIDAIVVELRDVEDVIGLEVICIEDAIGQDTLAYNSQ